MIIMTRLSKEMIIEALKRVCESYGVDPALIDFEAEVDETLTFEENYQRILPIIQSLAREKGEEEALNEYEAMQRQIEMLQRENEKLQRMLEKATLPKKHEYERRIREYKKRIEELENAKRELEKKMEELKKYGIMEKVIEEKKSEYEEKLREFEEAIKEATAEEIFTIFEMRRPEEISAKEWEERIEIAKRELKRRGFPTDMTGNILIPVRRIDDIEIPTEARIFYSKFENRYYIENKPVTYKEVISYIEKLRKPIEPMKYAKVGAGIPPYMPLESDITAKSIRDAVKLVGGLLMMELRKINKTLETATEDEVIIALRKLQKSFPRQVEYFMIYMYKVEDWRRRWHEFL